MYEIIFEASFDAQVDGYRKSPTVRGEIDRVIEAVEWQLARDPSWGESIEGFDLLVTLTEGFDAVEGLLVFYRFMDHKIYLVRLMELPKRLEEEDLPI